MMMNKKRQLALLVAACMVASGLLTLVPMGKSWATQNTSTTSTGPVTLSVGAAPMPFSFTNDTGVISFTCTIGNASTSPGGQFNLTVWNANGTQVQATVTVTHTVASGGVTMPVPNPVGNQFYPSIGGSTITVGDGVHAQDHEKPTNGSMLITAVTQEVLCISVKSTDFVQNSWTSWGGSIQVMATSGYQQTYASQSPVASGSTFSAVNVTGLTTPGVSTLNWFQEFNVSTAGWYYLQVNATNATIGPGPVSFYVLVLEKGKSSTAPLQMETFFGLTGIYNILGFAQFTSIGGKYYTPIYLSKPLATGTNYVLGVLGPYGMLAFCNVTALPTVTGALGSISCDFSSSSAIQTSASSYDMFVTLPTFVPDTVYATSLSSPSWPWAVATGSSSLFTLTNNVNYNNMQSENGSFLVSKSIEPDVSIDGGVIAKTDLSFNMYKDWSVHSSGGYYNTTGVPVWSKGTVSDTMWTNPLAQITATNVTTLGASNPGVVTLTVVANTTNVAALPGTQSTTDSAYYSNTFNFQNDGSQDTMGLYEIKGEAGKELQMQVTSISNLPVVGAVTSNTYSIQFGTADKLPVLTGSVLDYGYYLPSSYGSAISLTNTTWTHALAGNNYQGDSAITFEAALMTDPVYVLVTSTHVSNIAAHVPTSNSSSVALNWTYVPFLSSGDAYVQSRDNLIQCYDINMPVAGLAQISAVYGPCTISSPVTALVFPSPTNLPVLYATATGTSPVNTMTCTGSGYAFSFGMSFHAYVILDRSTGANAGSLNLVPNGSVLKLTITNVTPPDWLAWGLFVAALVALVIVAIVLSRKK